jgi:hypothetical protein
LLAFLAESAPCETKETSPRQKKRQKLTGEEISRLCAFAYILPGLLSDLEAD